MEEKYYSVRIATLCTIIGLISMSIIPLLIAIQVVSRNLGLIYLRNLIPLSETSVILSIWLVFLTLPQITIEQDHINVDYFYTKFSTKIQTMIDLSVIFIILISILSLFISSIILNLEIGSVSTSSGFYPSYALFVPIAIGTFIITLYYIELFAHKLYEML